MNTKKCPMGAGGIINCRQKTLGNFFEKKFPKSFKKLLLRNAANAAFL